MGFTRPEVGHRLALALRFVDAFTGELLATDTLDVRIAEFAYTPGIVRAPWVARSAGGVARFAVADREHAPIGPLTVSVNDRSGHYAAYEPIIVALPRPLTTHPPLPAAQDFLVDVPLWPALAYRPVAMETSVTGYVHSAGASAVAGLRVFVTRAGDVPSSYAYTDANGGFRARLVGPAFAVSTPTPPPPGDPWPLPTQSVALELRAPPSFAAPITIAALRCDGVDVAAPFRLNLGRNSLLDVTVA